jgi:hypothetical protein
MRKVFLLFIFIVNKIFSMNFIAIPIIKKISKPPEGLKVYILICTISLFTITALVKKYKKNTTR